jgi:hypothetical protein
VPSRREKLGILVTSFLALHHADFIVRPRSFIPSVNDAVHSLSPQSQCGFLIDSLDAGKAESMCAGGQKPVIPIFCMVNERRRDSTGRGSHMRPDKVR